MSYAEILGVDWFENPATPTLVYRKIKLSNYAGPAFRSAMAIVDAAINHPLVLSAENVVAVSQKTPSTGRQSQRKSCRTTTGSEVRPGTILGRQNRKLRQKTACRKQIRDAAASCSGPGQCGLSAVCFVAAPKMSDVSEIEDFRDASQVSSKTWTAVVWPHYTFGIHFSN